MRFDVSACNQEEVAALLGAEGENRAQPLNLPDDLLLRILKSLSTIHAPSIDQLAQTCRKMYLISRHPDLWRHMALQAEARSSPNLPYPFYPSYRDLFLLRPRIRTDGIYISKITYFRSGISENSMNNPVHLVTYYRYLRFFGASEGYTVWWLVSSKPPPGVIESLRNPKRMISSMENIWTGQTANIFHGHWNRSDSSDTTFHLNLADARKSTRMRWVMDLEMLQSKSNPIRHGVIKCTKYYAVQGGQPVDVSVDGWSRFIFSKVRSYLT